MKENKNGSPIPDDAKLHKTNRINEMYESWFLDYASYVILERAVPRIEDGFKPVQRRIMHALEVMNDGRFNKVANVIGSTMQYHPHGDASIGDAIVNVGQKGLLLDIQGNWGDVSTGDSAAAPRYIEARLSKFALDVVYNPDLTSWQLSYDGRKKEPITLPAKFPLLLALGADGIAVGLSTKILPHNFRELIQASINILKGKNVTIFPDFPSGGIADFSEYNQGLRGGKIKVRAKIEIIDNKTLKIKEIPFGTTTNTLIESIVKASEKGKIKIKKIIDNTAKDIDIIVNLQNDQPSQIAVDALYAFTECEVSISPNACVIIENRPVFMKVNEILKYNTDLTLSLLKKELEIKEDALKEKILFSSLVKIFIENKIYRNIEECKTFEEVIAVILRGLEPFTKQFYRVINEEDAIRLTEIKIKRISKFDSFQADELLKNLMNELKETQHSLAHLVDYAIKHFENLDIKYGAERNRKTQISNFQTVDAVEVIATNQKLYVDRQAGFIGWGLKKEEFLCDCSELDDVVVIRNDGKALVTRISEKVFVGKNILHVGLWKKGDDRMVYNLIYLDGSSGKSFAKRFCIPAIIRDKEYTLDQGNANSKVLYLSSNSNGEAEVVQIKLTQSCSARKKIFDFDFSSLEVKGRGAKGNIVTRYPIRKVSFVQAGESTLTGLDLWFDVSAGRLNRNERGQYLGKFSAEDQLLSISGSGYYMITGFDLNLRFEQDNTILIEKYDPDKIISAIYLDGESKQHFVKRFKTDATVLNKKVNFISDTSGSKLELATTAENMEVELKVKQSKGKNAINQVLVINLDSLIDVKGWKAKGNKLSGDKIIKITPVDKIKATSN